jgi:hypothetical protein
MQNDIRLQYQQTLDESHHGHPIVVQAVHTGGPGHPSIIIDPDFLRWAQSHRSTSAIGRFFGVSRSTVCSALIDYGIATLQPSPFVYNEEESPPSGVSVEHI